MSEVTFVPHDYTYDDRDSLELEIRRHHRHALLEFIMNTDHAEEILWGAITDYCDVERGNARDAVQRAISDLANRAHDEYNLIFSDVEGEPPPHGTKAWLELVQDAYENGRIVL